MQEPIIGQNLHTDAEDFQPQVSCANRMAEGKYMWISREGPEVVRSRRLESLVPVRAESGVETMRREMPHTLAIGPSNSCP